ncbi:MAG: hypothetical protein ACUVT7_00055 [Thermoplasmata archaeon]
MALSEMMVLASQAENEGITLAEKISKTLTAKEIAKMQEDLEKELASNYRNIESYMSGVDVPSIDDLIALDDEELLDLLGERVDTSSDDSMAQDEA